MFLRRLLNLKVFVLIAVVIGVLVISNSIKHRNDGKTTKAAAAVVVNEPSVPAASTTGAETSPTILPNDTDVQVGEEVGTKSDKQDAEKE